MHPALKRYVEPPRITVSHVALGLASSSLVLGVLALLSLTGLV